MARAAFVSTFRAVGCLAAVTFATASTAGLSATEEQRNPPELAVQFVVRPPVDADSNHEVSGAGHIFMILKTYTASGVKEDIFGFYPTASGGKGVIRGPGMLRAEWRCRNDCLDDTKDLARVSEATKSADLPITTEQREAIFSTIHRWNESAYDLLVQNCTHFIGDVAQAVGVQRPIFRNGMPPTAYMILLKRNVERELKRREDEKERGELDQVERRLRENIAAQERIKRLREELARKERENAAAEERRRQEEANRIPSGWVPCTCPASHRSNGRVIQGTRYHPSGVRCPQIGRETGKRDPYAIAPHSSGTGQRRSGVMTAHNLEPDGSVMPPGRRSK